MEEDLKYTFNKEERLHHKQRFDQLLASGESFVVYPLRVIFRISERPVDMFPARLAVSVPKKRFKRAVKRNRIKRLIREAYRLHKPQLYTGIPVDKTVDMLFIYLHENVAKYPKFEKAIGDVIKKIQLRFEPNPDGDVVAAD